MTVKELIELLQKQPQDKQVLLAVQNHYLRISGAADIKVSGVGEYIALIAWTTDKI